MDKIVMKNLAFYGYHGVLKEENSIGQKFFVDIEIFTSLRQAGETDNVDDTINYSLIYEVVKDIVENKRFKLIEALAEEISKAILHKFLQVKEIKIGIKKPEAPVPGIYDYFGVEIRRSQND